MIEIDQGPIITVLGGGSGPISTEVALLNLTPNIVSITGVHDSGGHSGKIRSIIGSLPPGDATQRIAAHITDSMIRNLFTFRWDLEEHKDKEKKMNGHRPSNDFLAAAEKLSESHSAGIKLVEKMISAHYRGLVVPITDDNIHLVAHFAEGEPLVGEKKIDTRTTNFPPYKSISFVDKCLSPINPTANPEAIDYLTKSDAIVFGLGSWWTSTRPLLETPGVIDAINESRAKVIFISNALSVYSETDGYDASTFLKQTVKDLGIRVDIAFINNLSHCIPKSYEDDRSYPIRPDLDECREYVSKIIFDPFTCPYEIGGKTVIRHEGNEVAKRILSSIS